MIMIVKHNPSIFFVVIGFAFLLAGCAVPASTQKQRGSDGFVNSIRYLPPYGKVGHHYSLGPKATCGETWYCDPPEIVRGTLPPGLSIDNFGTIEGTPRQPGQWSVTIRFSGLKCRGQSYPDQDVRLNLTIEGIAVRGVR